MKPMGAIPQRILKVTLKSKKPEEVQTLFARFAFWGDTCESSEEGNVYSLHRAEYQNVEGWCKSALELKMIEDYTIVEIPFH